MKGVICEPISGGMGRLGVTAGGGEKEKGKANEKKETKETLVA